MIVFLYDITYNACQANFKKLVSIGARRYNDYIWSCAYMPSKDQVEELKKLGIGVDNPLDRVDKSFRDLVELVFKSPFWEYKMTVEKEEYDLRKEGNVVFVSDRGGYRFSIIQKTPKGFESVYLSSSDYRIKETLKDFLYKNPVQKVVLHHDFWDRPTSYEASKITDPNPNILSEAPLDYPKPAIPETVRVIESKSGTATATLMAIMPPAGTEVRVELEDIKKTEKFWQGATYQNKEKLKMWGACWDAENKVWYFLRVPSEERQQQITEMGIKLKVRSD